MDAEEARADELLGVAAEHIGAEEEEKYAEMVARFKTFVLEKQKKRLHEAVSQEQPFIIDFKALDKFSPELSGMLLEKPDLFFQAADEALGDIDLGTEGEYRIPVRINNLLDVVGIRDLRSRHINRFVAAEGIVRKSSEIRPEVVSILWECALCGDRTMTKRQGMFIGRPFECANGHKGNWRHVEKKLIDVRWIVIEEPFELTEGDKPSQVTIMLQEDLCDHEGRRNTDPGNRLRITGILRDMPKGKSYNVKLDFYLAANHIEPTEIGWEKIKITKKDEEEIKALAKRKDVYEIFTDSLAPSIYGMREIKESIILQLFGGVQRNLRDRSRIRGEVHILLIGDPSSGKSQILKLVPKIVPRGKYVSGKGTTTAGLTATVSKDEQFMGGWVLEAGAMVLANKGLLAIDEFEKMSPEDQVAMHEAMEQGCYDYQTELVLENGQSVQIGELVEQHVGGLSGEDVWKDISGKNIKIMSTDFKKIKPSRISAVRKHRENRLYELTLYTGQQIRITPKHPVFVIRKGGITFVQAEDLKADDWVPVPLYLPVKGRRKRFHAVYGKVNRKEKSIIIPKESNETLCEWLGYVVAEGNAEINRKKCSGVCFTNSEKEIIDRYIYCTENLFGIKPYIQKLEGRVMVRSISRHLYKFVSSIGAGILVKSYNKELPEWALCLPKKETASLLKGLFSGDGSVNYAYGTVTFTTTSRRLTEQVQRLLLRLGIFCGIYRDSSLKGKRKRIAFEVQISGKQNIAMYSKLVGFAGRKKERLEKLSLKKTVSSRWNHIPNMVNTIESVKKSLRLSDIDIAGYVLHDKRERNFISKPLFRKIIRSFEKRIAEIERLLSLLETRAAHEDYKAVRKKLKISRSEIARRLGMRPQNLWYHEAVKREQSLIKVSINETKAIAEEMLKQKESVAALKNLLNSPVEWVKIKEIRERNGSRWVYDVEMNPTRTFIGNGIVCHNSVSIAKASIVTTLPAQTSVIAGGNPKFSRFDAYMPITKQITITDTLLTRFDLKFILRDVPNEETDRKVVDHVLSSREEDYEPATPKLESEFIRRYIAYAKEKYKPSMPKECGKMLKKFYVDIRRKAQQQGAPLPITLRQFEALIRLSEASAKIQLQEFVRMEDVKRAIRLMEFSLRQLGFDPETGTIDIDKAEGATPARERSQIRIILDIIEELSRKSKDIKVEEIIDLARKEDIKMPEALIERLKREGMLFEPSPGFVQKL